MSLAFDPSVEDDLADAAAFYEARSPGLGEDFLSEFRRMVDEIVHAPSRWPGVEGGPIRRCLLDRFPYVVHYHADAERVLVLAVTHTRRHQEAWKRRR